MAETKKWEVLVRFYEMTGWRVVEAADSTGRRTPCLLLPMDINGICLTKDRNQPYMRFAASAVSPDKNATGFFRCISPLLSKSMHDELVAKGVMPPAEKGWTTACGGIRAYGYHKANLPKKK